MSSFPALIRSSLKKALGILPFRAEILAQKRFELRPIIATNLKWSVAPRHKGQWFEFTPEKSFWTQLGTVILPGYSKFKETISCLMPGLPHIRNSSRR
jgi:hypothetical protein